MGRTVFLLLKLINYVFLGFRGFAHHLALARTPTAASSASVLVATNWMELELSASIRMNVKTLTNVEEQSAEICMDPTSNPF